MKGAELAAQAERNGAEIWILVGGGAAQIIKKAVTITVIDVQLSGYDIIRSLTLAHQFDGQRAIVDFTNITSGAHSIINLIDVHPAQLRGCGTALLELKASGTARMLVISSP